MLVVSLGNGIMFMLSGGWRLFFALMQNPYLIPVVACLAGMSEASVLSQCQMGYNFPILVVGCFAIVICIYYALVFFQLHLQE